jgi:hypothetical protein
MAKISDIDMAEKELVNVIGAAEDFFSSVEEKEALLQRIRKDPEAILASSEKPFMKKIARAMLHVAALKVKEYTPESFTKALAHQKLFLEAEMEERIAAERNRVNDLLLEQQAYFEGKLSTEIIRMERVHEDHKRMMKAGFALLSNEIELKGEHIVNLSKLLKRIRAKRTEEEWVSEIDKCVPR